MTEKKAAEEGAGECVQVSNHGDRENSDLVGFPEVLDHVISASGF